MTKDHNQVRLADFGLAQELAMDEYATSNCEVSRGYHDVVAQG